MNELIIAVSLFAFSSGFWIIIYIKWLLPKIRNDNIGALERGEIKIKSEWLEDVIEQIVTRTRHLFLADLGQLAHQGGGQGSDEAVQVAGLGGGVGDLLALDGPSAITAAEALLKSVGMKKPPPMLVFKVGQALGGLLERYQSGPGFKDGAPPADYTSPDFGQ